MWRRQPAPPSATSSDSPWSIIGRMPAITLLTDFGLQDEFAGLLRGAILSVHPRAQIVDLCHAVPPGDCRRAAYLLSWAFPFFPRGTIHAAVVDPGVGTRRRILCAHAHGQLFLAPDNGLLTLVLGAARRPIVHEVRDPRYWRPMVSATFHGRDIVAPVAAHLARGLNPARLGPRTTTWQRLAFPVVRRRGWRLEAEVIDIDRFGNLTTNLDASCMPPRSLRSASCRIRVKGQVIQGAGRTYGDAREGALTAMISSRGLLEIAVRGGSAARRLHARVGDRVVVEAP